MVSLNPNPQPQEFCLDPLKMGRPGFNSPLTPPTNTTTTAIAANTTALSSEDPNKRVRKPYTITKSRESWTEQEHDKFLEALHLFDRDWKKIEAFVGSKTVVQIRSHAQKYFLKVQKNGASEHVPPPRPKRKAVHPYPQKASKNGCSCLWVIFCFLFSTMLSVKLDCNIALLTFLTSPMISQVTGAIPSSPALHEPGCVLRPDSLPGPSNPDSSAALISWTYNTVPPVSVPHEAKDDIGLSMPPMAQNCSYSSSNESNQEIWPTGGTNVQEKGKHGKPIRVMPDFAQVYSFIGNVFDPNASGHLQKLKKMDPINVETVVVLMKNLSANLASPEFENHRRLLLSYDIASEKAKFSSPCNNLHADKPDTAILSV